jgi:hypothetical protein
MFEYHNGSKFHILDIEKFKNSPDFEEISKIFDISNNFSLFAYENARFQNEFLNSKFDNVEIYKDNVNKIFNNRQVYLSIPLKDYDILFSLTSITNEEYLEKIELFLGLHSKICKIEMNKNFCLPLLFPRNNLCLKLTFCSRDKVPEEIRVLANIGYLGIEDRKKCAKGECFTHYSFPSGVIQADLSLEKETIVECKDGIFNFDRGFEYEILNKENTAIIVNHHTPSYTFNVNGETIIRPEYGSVSNIKICNVGILECQEKSFCEMSLKTNNGSPFILHYRVKNR